MPLKITIRQSPSGGHWTWSIGDKKGARAASSRTFKTKGLAWADAKHILNTKKLDVVIRSNADREAEAAAAETS